jgi:hypothetical protein
MTTHEASWRRRLVPCTTPRCTALLGALLLAACVLQEDPARDALAVSEPTSGPIFITGHDPDFHAQGEAGARRLLVKAVEYVRHGSPLPFLWVESRIQPPTGHRVGKNGLRAIGLVEGADFIHMNAAELAAQTTGWWESLASRYSAIAVASDFGGLLTQAELDQLNAHRDDITRFVNSGGGLLALSEGGGGARLTTHDRFGFLPIDVDSTGNAVPPYTVTSYGQNEFGLIDSDVNSPSHSHFNADFGLNVVSLSAPTGQIMTLAGKARITDGGFLVANAGPDITLDATAALTPVVLDGSGSSTDPAGAPLRYIWQEAGLVLADTTSPTVSIALAPGIHTITLTVVNSRDESASDEVVITILDTLPPSITCPADMVVPTEPDVCSAHVSFPPPDVDGSDIVSVSCDHRAGDPLPGGITPVTCTAMDARGHQASCTFIITVRDGQAPLLAPPSPVTMPADALCEAPVPDLVPDAEASDNCTHDHHLVFAQEPAPGTRVGPGIHDIRIRVTDEAGNSTTASTTYTVLDATPPAITRVTPSPSVLWPPNHRMVPVIIDVDVHDACDSAVQCTITGITSNQPVNGIGDGNTEPDWEITGPLSASLRAERAGPLGERIYTLDVRCTDDSGNASTATTTVSVPHDRRDR